VYVPTPPVVPPANAVTAESGDAVTLLPEITERTEMAPELTAVTVSVFPAMKPLKEAEPVPAGQ